eukprot:CAMPEP_0185032028 /NCGR_PEP_ID=MMETSP1103-20130426/19848_1 /TAXON_ID=36769 /ORGANISM="Paraphysomonas bandaiensis, Strain Caron Lab Isolate" /LENGTH=327 /DNA_ID=CAMNT_0027567765 /DNA_START=162 /DNA_END=1142 /DNA_ORIENTATION=+
MWSLTLGMARGVPGLFDARTFILGLTDPGAWYRVLAIVAGGVACANSDFLAACACTRLPFAVVVPVFMGWSLIQATILNFIIEGSDCNIPLLFSGVFLAFMAICAMALSDSYASTPVSEFSSRLSRTSMSAEASEVQKSLLVPDVSASDEEKVHSRKPVSPWMYVSVLSGIFGGIWSPLQVVGRSGHNAVGNASVCLFFFQLGEILTIPLILWYHGRVIVVLDTKMPPVSISSYMSSVWNLPAEDKMYGILAGGMVASGTYIFFTASEVIPSTVSFAICSCAPLVTIVIGVCIFKQLKKATFYQTFYIAVSTVLFISAIALMVLADM